jgi:hypothetical protein
MFLSFTENIPEVGLKIQGAFKVEIHAMKTEQSTSSLFKI